MPVLNLADAVMLGGSAVDKVYVGDDEVWSAGGEGPALPSIGGLWAHYDASTLALSDTDPVATWPDASGGGRDLAQASSSERPLYRTGIAPNGGPGVRFDGSNDRMFASWTSPGTDWTIFYAATMGAGDNKYLCDGRTSGGRIALGDPNNNTSSWAMYTNVGSITATDSNRPLPYSVFAARVGGGADGAAIRRNGTTYGAGTLSRDLAGITVGCRFSNLSGNFMATDISEILYYAAHLSDTDIAAVEAYLTDKWGL